MTITDEEILDLIMGDWEDRLVAATRHSKQPATSNEASEYAGQCDECGGSLMTDGDTYYCTDCDYCEGA